METSTSESLLLQILDNQRDDGARLARVETLTQNAMEEILQVKQAQISCPGRIAEVHRQARRATWIVAGKVVGWGVGIAATAAGAMQTVSTIFGG